MKILIVTEYFPESAECEVRGGVEARAFYFAKELAKEHTVTVLCAREVGQGEEDIFLGFTVYRCGIARAYAQGGSIFSRFSFLWSAIWRGRSLEIDVVDGYNFIAYLAAFFIALGRRGIRKIATYHDVWIGEWIRNVGLVSGIFGEILERFSLRVSWDGIIAVSEYTKNKLIARRMNPQKIIVIPNGVDIKEYESVQVKKFEHPTVAYVGRLVEYKRVEDLLHAIKIVKKQIPEVQCKIIGSGPRENKLKALARELGIDRRVEFLGFVPERKDVIALVKRSHVFCLPSLVEGFGMVTIEAMAAGLPFVNSDIPATREITGGGIGGLLFEPKNIEDLAEKIVLTLGAQNVSDHQSLQKDRLFRMYEWNRLSYILVEAYKHIV